MIQTSFSVIPWFAWIAIVAILMGGVKGVFEILLKHRERMAMIRQGIHPDHPDPIPVPTAKASYPEL